MPGLCVCITACWTLPYPPSKGISAVLTDEALEGASARVGLQPSFRTPPPSALEVLSMAPLRSAFRP